MCVGGRRAAHCSGCALHWEAISDPEGGIWIQGSDYIDSVEQIDDTTFVVHYTSVFPGYLTQFGGDQVVIWPAHYCDAAQGFVAWDCNRQPLSSGPYVLTEWVTGDHLTFGAQSGVHRRRDALHRADHRSGWCRSRRCAGRCSRAATPIWMYGSPRAVWRSSRTLRG